MKIKEEQNRSQRERKPQVFALAWQITLQSRWKCGRVFEAFKQRWQTTVIQDKTGNPLLKLLLKIIVLFKVFEKKNQKSAQNIAQLQKKLETYQRKVRMMFEIIHDIKHGTISTF